MSMSRVLWRLHNWGAWARSDEDGPGKSCIASFWRKWTSSSAWDHYGWGDPNPPDGPDTGSIDVEDAEVIDGWVRQCPQMARIALVRRFVHGHRPSTPAERKSSQEAVQTLLRVMGENGMVVQRIRVLVRGKA